MTFKTIDMKLEELKRGDEINVVWGGDSVKRAKVLRNYKGLRLIHIRIGWLVPMKSLDSYDHPYRFSLLND